MTGYFIRTLPQNKYSANPIKNAIKKSGLTPPKSENKTKNAIGKYLLLIVHGKQQKGLYYSGVAYETLLM